MVVPVDGPMNAALAGITHEYEVAPVDPAVEYTSIVFAHGDAFPEIEGGVAGAPYTPRIR